MKRGLRFMVLLLAVLLVALAVETYTRVEPVEEFPEVPGAQLPALALHPALVRVTGQLVTEDGAPPANPDILLERVTLDSGRYPRPSWKERIMAFLLHQQLPSWLDYDMVSPPRVGLKVAPDLVVALQTEDIDLGCWPPATTVQIPPGGANPLATQMLPTLPDVPTPVGTGTLVIRLFKPDTTVTVIGEIAKDGDLTVLRPKDHHPFVVSAMAYEDVRSRLLSEQHGWEAASAALLVVGLVLGTLAMRGRF